MEGKNSHYSRHLVPRRVATECMEQPPEELPLCHKSMSRLDATLLGGKPPKLAPRCDEHRGPQPPLVASTLSTRTLSSSNASLLRRLQSCHPLVYRAILGVPGPQFCRPQLIVYWGTFPQWTAPSWELGPMVAPVPLQWAVPGTIPLAPQHPGNC